MVLCTEFANARHGKWTAMPIFISWQTFYRWWMAWLQDCALVHGLLVHMIDKEWNKFYWSSKNQVFRNQLILIYIAYIILAFEIPDTQVRDTWYKYNPLLLIFPISTIWCTQYCQFWYHHWLAYAESDTDILNPVLNQKFFWSTFCMNLFLLY